MDVEADGVLAKYKTVLILYSESQGESAVQLKGTVHNNNNKKTYFSLYFQYYLLP